ncbi:MAG: PTS transporter subunit EIIA [Granulosicoccus sp.]|nr:PTS transporter subunit EIIA [Granulosicoccus sp.]
MVLSDLLEPGRIRCRLGVQSKKRTLQTLAELLGESLRADSAESVGNAPDAAQDDGADDSEAATRKVRKSLKNDARSEDAPETLSDMQILDALISRERLGSTGLGHGVGLPHSRMSSIQRPIAAFVTLESGVDYESADGEPVDLVLGLLVPEDCNDEHLKILAQLARRFSDSSLRDSLRSFTDPERLYQHLASLEPAAH